MTGLSRKTVTVLFSDIVDSTPLGERLDAESVRDLMARYFDAMSAVIERHGGTVEKYVGDAIMAVFGIPRVHEDDALRAVRAAAEMREALAALNRGLAQPLSARTALNTGEIVTGDGHTLITGDAVNLAKRLEQAAEGGEILIGGASYALVGNAVIAEPLEPLTVKGKEAPVEAWRVTAVLPGTLGRARRFDAALVGRRSELALLRQAQARAVGTRSCHLFTMLGAAGAGKSRLANELLAELRDEATVLVGRCLPYGDGITFWPLRDVVHAVGELGSLVGERDAAVLAGAVGAGETLAPPEETARALRRLVEAVARKRPVVLVLEDIHWAEGAFLDLLEHLAGATHDAPVLLLCLARPELLEDRPTWAGGRLNATTILLEPLDVEESLQLVENLAGSALTAATRQTITEVAEGNPLFLEEMVAMIVDDGRTDAVPPTIHALLSARLERLPEEERDVLAAAAVAGRFFSVAAVEALTGETVDAHLTALERKELIRPQRVSFAEGDAYRFRHILIRDAAYDALPKTRRAEMHERLADWLSASDDEVEELVGWHLEQSARYRAELGAAVPELARRASTVLGAAGRRAFARDDARAAVTLLDRAATIVRRGEPGRSALLADLGSALMKTGDFTRADAALAEAIEQGEPQVRLRARVDREFVRSYLHPETGSGSLRRVADEVIPELEELGDDLGLAKAWWLLSEAHSIACRWGLRAEALERALVYARRAGASDQVATLIAHLAQALYYGPTPVEEALERCELLLGEARGDRSLEASLTSPLAGLRAMRGEFDEARRLWARAAATYEDLGLEFRRAARSLVIADVETLAGDLTAAESELRRGYETLETMGERGVRSTISAFLARTLVAQGRFDDAQRYVRFSEEAAGADDLVTHGVLRATQAELRAHGGEFGAAEQLAFDAVRLADSTDFLDLQAHAQLSLAAVLEAPGRAEEVEAARARASEIFMRKGNVVAARRTAQTSGTQRS